MKASASHSATCKSNNVYSSIICPDHHPTSSEAVLRSYSRFVGTNPVKGSLLLASLMSYMGLVTILSSQTHILSHLVIWIYSELTVLDFIPWPCCQSNTMATLYKLWNLIPVAEIGQPYWEPINHSQKLQKVDCLLHTPSKAFLIRPSPGRAKPCEPQIFNSLILC